MLPPLESASIQFSLVTQSCLTLCNQWTAGHQASLSITNFQSLTKLIHWVSDAIQPSHPLSPLSLPALNLSQHQGLFKWVSSSQQVAKVLEFQFQHQSIQWIFKVNFLSDWLVWSPSSPKDSQESSLTSQLESINASVLSLLYSPTFTSTCDYWKNNIFD